MKKKAPDPETPEASTEAATEGEAHYAESTVPVGFDVGARLGKDRAGPAREKYPITEGQANFASMADRAREAVAAASATPDHN